MRLRTVSPIAPASVSRDYRTADREIHVSVTVPSSHPGRAFADAVAVRALRCELLAEHLEQDTSALDGRAALRVFRTVAEQRNGSTPVVGRLNGEIAR